MVGNGQWFSVGLVVWFLGSVRVVFSVCRGNVRWFSAGSMVGFPSFVREFLQFMVGECSGGEGCPLAFWRNLEYNRGKDGDLGESVARFPWAAWSPSHGDGLPYGGFPLVLSPLVFLPPHSPLSPWSIS